MSAFGGKGTWPIAVQMSAYDPKRTRDQRRTKAYELRQNQVITNQRAHNACASGWVSAAAYSATLKEADSTFATGGISAKKVLPCQICFRSSMTSTPTSRP